MSETEESAVNKITQKEYADILKEVSPDSPLGPDMLKAFVVGGIICTIGQCFLNFYMKILQERDLASTATSISLIFIAAALTACNVFDSLAKFAGAGTLVPITGFSNAVVSPAMEYKTEGYILGIGSKMFVIAGPVIVYGTASSVIAGLIWMIIR
mgnify:FL=1